MRSEAVAMAGPGMFRSRRRRRLLFAGLGDDVQCAGIHFCEAIANNPPAGFGFGCTLGFAFLLYPGNGNRVGETAFPSR